MSPCNHWRRALYREPCSKYLEPQLRVSVGEFQFSYGCLQYLHLFITELLQLCFWRFVWTWVMGCFRIKITFRLWQLKCKKWNKINVKTKMCPSVDLYMRNKNVQLAGTIKFCTILHCIVWRHSTLNYMNISFLPTGEDLYNTLVQRYS